MSEVEVNKTSLFDALSGALARWDKPGFADKFPDPRDESKRARYVVGAPREVRFAPYPLLFSCRKCGRVASYDRLQRSDALPGRCIECNGTLSRMRYVQAHNCGRLEELRLPIKRCPNGHGPEHLVFYDPGRVRQARWRCKACGADIQGLRMTPCKCAYSDSLPPGTPTFEQWLKVIPTGDPSLYITHTFAFINFPEESDARKNSSSDHYELMLARVLGVLDEPVDAVFRRRCDAKSSQVEGSEASELLEALRVANPNHPLVIKHDLSKAKPPGQVALDELKTLVGEITIETPARRRWLSEHVTLQDKTDSTTVSDVVQTRRNQGVEAEAQELEDAKSKANEFLGIGEMRIVNNFPLALCAFGFTRTAREPSRTIINPFPVDENARVPLYVIDSETEALWFRLDPIKVVNWLIKNELAAGEPLASGPVAWAWLYRNIPALREPTYIPALGDRRAILVRTLLHTMSHAFLRRIEWSGFSPSSVGEYLIPGSLSFILYANRYAESKIGGLTTLFEQRLGTWLWDAYQSSRDCVYDPLCMDDGGSCAGCTHREHNCITFNRELSRATLYGGPTSEGVQLGGIAIREGFWAHGWRVAPNA